MWDIIINLINHHPPDTLLLRCRASRIWPNCAG
jgi:hypothetical protein